MVKKNSKKNQLANKNDNIDITKSISAIRKAILTSEEDNILDDNLEKRSIASNDDHANLLLLDNIISDEDSIKKINTNNSEKEKGFYDKNILPELNTSIKTSNKEIGVESTINREINPIIKEWISANLKNFVKKIVKEEISFISKLTEPPKKR